MKAPPMVAVEKEEGASSSSRQKANTLLTIIHLRCMQHLQARCSSSTFGFEEGGGADAICLFKSCVVGFWITIRCCKQLRSPPEKEYSPTEPGFSCDQELLGSQCSFESFLQYLMFVAFVLAILSGPLNLCLSQFDWSHLSAHVQQSPLLLSDFFLFH